MKLKPQKNTYKVNILLFSLQFSCSKKTRRVNSHLSNLQILITKNIECTHLLERCTSIWAEQIIKKNCHKLFTLVHNFWMEVRLFVADNPRKLCRKKREREKKKKPININWTCDWRPGCAINTRALDLTAPITRGWRELSCGFEGYNTNFGVISLPFISTRLSLLTSALVNMFFSSVSERLSPQLRITLFKSSNVMKPSPSASKSRNAWRSSAWWPFSFVWDIITRNSLKSMWPLPKINPSQIVTVWGWKRSRA